MATFQFVDTGGQLQTTEAANAQEALGSAKNLGATSGVRELTDVAQQAGQVGQTKVSPTIDAGDLNTQQIDTAPVDNFKQQFGSGEDIKNTINSTDFFETQSTREIDAVTQEMANLLGESREVDEIDLVESAGIPELESELSDIIGEASLLRASLSSGLVNEENRPIAMEFITGRQAHMKRQAAAQLEGLAASAAMIEGRIGTVQNRIDRSLDRKYGMIEAELEAKKVLINRLSSKESRELSFKLSIAEAELAQDRDMEENAYNAVVQAVEFGFDRTKGGQLIKDLSSGKIEPGDVISAVGGNLRDPLKVMQQQLASIQLNNAMKSQQKVQSGVWTEDQAEVVNDLTKQLRGEQGYKEMYEAKAGYTTAKVGLEQNNGLGDIAAVNGYQRMIDPGATVRGEDVKTQAEAVAFIQKALNIPGRIFNGDRFTPEVRTVMQEAIDGQYDERLEQFNSTTKSRYDRVINNNPTLSGADISFEDIGDSFNLEDDADTEAINIEQEPVGTTFFMDGIEYIKVGINTLGESLVEPVN